jgi:DUF438 domain-containing protein
MSEFLVQDREKQEQLKAIIRKLHGGASVSEVKSDFGRLIKDVSAEEIAAMEQALIEGGFPPEEIQRLCDVHVEVFESSLKKDKRAYRLPGHPVHTFMEENREAKKRSRRLISAARSYSLGLRGSGEVFLKALGDMKSIEVHYTRKENQLFPYLERKGFTGPSKVMWGKHDEIRALFKRVYELFDRGERKAVLSETRDLVSAVRRMIFMEERILYPNSVKRLSEAEWAEIRRGESAIGYAWVNPGAVWDAAIASSSVSPEPLSPATSSEPKSPDSVPLKEGALTREQLDLLLTNLPVDVSFIDENDKVLYYSDSKERVFPRSPAIIGRDVQNCHPHKSVHIVNRILDAFKNKEKDRAEFWITMNGRFIRILYVALYDESGSYRGTLEVSQDATDIRGLTGERRLLDW